MNTDIRLHDLVALLVDTPAKHFETDQPLLLRRGQLGTVVMIDDSEIVEVELADALGRTYASLPVPGDRLMRLRDTPHLAVA